MPEKRSRSAKTTPEVGLTEANAIVDAVAEDERLAAEARQSPLEPLDVAGPGDPDEAVFAIRPSAMIEESAATPFGGTLYLTNRRLAIRGRERSRDIALEEIEGMAAVGSRVLELVLTPGPGLALQVDRPRLLQAQIERLRRQERSATDG